VDLQRSSIGLVPVDPDLPVPPSTFPRADGQFTLNGVMSGNYVLDVSNLPGDVYVKAARFGTVDILPVELILEAQPSETALQLLLGTDGGSVEVTVVNMRNQPHPDAHVVLVPDSQRRSYRQHYRLAETDADGRATLRGIPPGTYSLLAWQDLEPNAYLNSEYLRVYESLATRINIVSGRNRPVSVRLIPKE
jgi:hypothetical protein